MSKWQLVNIEGNKLNKTFKTCCDVINCKLIDKKQS